MDYFTSMGVGDTFVRAGHVFRENWKPFLLISLVGHLVTLGIMHVSFHILWMLKGSNGDHSDHHHWAGKRMHNGVSYYDLSDIVVFSIEMVVYAMVMSIPEGAIIRGVAEFYAGREIDVKDVMKKSAKKLRAMIGASAIAILAYMVPLLFPDLVASTITEGVWAAKILERVFIAFLGIVLYQVYPSIIVESRGAIKAIDRSIDLSENCRLYILAVTVVYGIAKYAFEKVVFEVEKVPHFARFVTWVILSIFFSCFECVLKSVVYLNVRISKESMSLEVLERDLNESGGSLDDALAGYLALGGSGDDDEDIEGNLNEMVFDS